MFMYQKKMFDQYYCIHKVILVTEKFGEKFNFCITLWVDIKNASSRAKSLLIHVTVDDINFCDGLRNCMRKFSLNLHNSVQDWKVSVFSSPAYYTIMTDFIFKKWQVLISEMTNRQIFSWKCDGFHLIIKFHIAALVSRGLGSFSDFSIKIYESVLEI